MDERLQLRVQRYGWDAAAAAYERGWRAPLRAVQRSLLEASELRAGMRVVETAAGSGLVSREIAAAVGASGEVLATDLSGEMVALGAEMARRSGLSNLRFERMDAQSLNCGDADFDRAVCALGLMYVPNPAAALAQMHRVLTPGGRVAVAVWGRRQHCGWADIFPIVDARVKSEVCPLFFGLGASGALVQALRGSGFSSIAENRFRSDLSFSSATALLEAILDGGPVALAAKRFEPPTRREIERDFLRSVEPYRRGDGYEIPGEFVVCAGKR